MLPLATADRVRRLIPMLSSSHDCEVIATRDAIGRTLAASGSDWHGLAASITGTDRSPPAPPAPTPSPCSDRPPNFGDLARACRDLDRGRLKPNERTFVLQMCRMGFSGRPTLKQLEWLTALFARLQRRAAA